MENIGAIENDEKQSWSKALSDSNLSNVRNEVSSGLIYGNGLETPILGSAFRAPDIPKKYIEPTILETSLPYIPVYTHLNTYDMKHIERPSTPPILSELRSKYHFREETDSYRSSKASPSTGRTSKGRSSITLKPRESARSSRME